MFELLLCSMLTVLPDFLWRRYGQRKRLGHEINLFSVWYELRWGITLCLILTISLITTIFYFHPSTTSAVSSFRTITILPEGSGRVTEVHVGFREFVRAGQPLFALDKSEQETALATARLRVQQLDAELIVARAELFTAEAQIAQAQAGYLQALETLETRLELQRRNSDTVAPREIERLENTLAGAAAARDAASAAKDALQTRIDTLLPSQRAIAVSQVTEAEADLAKRVIYAGVDGWLEQFILRPGDLVSQVMRPAGILVPAEAGRLSIQAGFGQIEAQVLRVGMIGEVACIAKPFTVVPVVVTELQGVIASGQIRPTDALVDPATTPRGGTLLAYLEPLFPGQLDDLPPGSNCIANAYTSNHERLLDPELGTLTRFALHAVDTVGLVHAMILRLQALFMPVRTLVLSGGH
jgi:multidrug resistance efflux pump